MSDSGTQNAIHLSSGGTFIPLKMTTRLRPAEALVATASASCVTNPASLYVVIIRDDLLQTYDIRRPAANAPPGVQGRTDELDVSYGLSRAAMACSGLFTGTRTEETLTHPIALPRIDTILEAQLSDFLAQVEALDKVSVQAATFKVYDLIEQLLFDRSFRLCDRILRRLDVSRLSTTVLRAFLTITWEHRLDLEERAGLYERVRCRMLEIRGPEVTERLLSRLA